VELTRRGRPVAVLLSLTEFERLRRPRLDFWSACQQLRERFDLDKLDIDPDEVFAVSDDSSAGRDFSW
jgi:antitoxin (DNA-binding transcriptional repressor) of toxin-antitoxin stability system